MAILLPQFDTMIQEIPKTGTTWMRNALEQLGVEHKFAVPARDNCCPRHAPYYYYREKAKRVLCVVRHPQDWMESYWRYHPSQGFEIFEPHRFYPHKILHPVHADFEEWIESVMWKERYCVMKIFDTYRSPAIKSETLTEEFAAIIKMPVADVAAVPRANESEKRPCKWDSRLLEKFDYYNRIIYERYGYEPRTEG